MKILDGNWEEKNAPSPFSKLLNTEIKQLLLILKRLNILVTPVIILAKSAKRFYENLYTKETASKTATSDFLGKPLTERESPLTNFTFVRREA